MIVEKENIHISRAEKHDLEIVLLLIHAVIKEWYSKIYPTSVVDFFLEYHNKDSIDNIIEKGTLFIMQTSTTTLAVGHIIDNRLGGMYVDPAHQNQGIGRLMMNTLIDEARKRNLSEIVLDATLMAYPLYQRMGFITEEFTYDEMPNKDRLYYFKMRMVL